MRIRVRTGRNIVPMDVEAKVREIAPAIMKTINKGLYSRIGMNILQVAILEYQYA